MRSDDNGTKRGTARWAATGRAQPAMSIGEGDDAMQDSPDKANYDRLHKDIDIVKAAIAKLAEQVTGSLNAFAGSAQADARHSYKQARSNAESMASDMNRQGSAILDSAHDAASAIGESVEGAVQQRPLAAMGLALGLGLLIGVSWRR
jgi:ElaB/YqjD/DUF883 family membrane-anchored ribosome-binding protein